MQASLKRKQRRILLAKPGLDGHDRGAHVVAHALRDFGYEVIYSGLRQTPQAVVQAALQEDVEAIGLSVLSGGHLRQFSEVFSLMRQNKMEDVLLFGGGIIPQKDKEELQNLGVGALFGPGTPLKSITTYLEEHFSQKEKSEESPTE